jgi:hypothetical protein
VVDGSELSEPEVLLASDCSPPEQEGTQFPQERNEDAEEGMMAQDVGGLLSQQVTQACEFSFFETK